MNQHTARQGFSHLFDNETKANLQKALDQIGHVIDVNYEFTDDGLVLSGLERGTITLTHPRSARAYLDAWLSGYSYGFSVGRNVNRDD
jgi:hypothetical protein